MGSFFYEKMTLNDLKASIALAKKGKSYAIADQLGNGYLVDKDGKITKTTATEVANATARGQREYSKDPNLSVLFAKAEGTKFGFDEQREGTLQENYQQTENGKWIAWKALPSGGTDKVAVTPEGTTDLSKVKFKVEGSTPLPIAIGTNTQALTLTGSTHGTTEELLAYYPQQDTSKDDVVVGKLNVVSYDEVKKNLVIVEVNNATYPGNINTLTNELNKTYAQGVAGWASVTKQSMTVTGLGEKLDDGESGLLSNYTADMKTVLNAFTKNNTLATDTYYLFLIKAANDPNKLGYMPRKKQAGFIFLDAHGGNEAQLINTVAHELGHGAFRLKHTFSEYPSLSQGATDNLMDYNRGIRLNKYQWDYIHNPEVVLGLFEGDEEGSLVSAELGKDLATELLQLIHAANLNKLALTDISIYSDKKSTISDFEVDKLKLDLLYINVMAMSIISTDRTQNIKPSEISKETLSTWNGSSGDFLKYTFHKDGLIGPLLNTNNNSLEIVIKKTDKIEFENYLFLKDPAKDGLERVDIAKRIFNTDDRRYGRFIEPERKTDDYIDCAEFVYEVLRDQGFTNIPSGGCEDQKKWFEKMKNNAQCIMNDDIDEIIAGDIIIWGGKWEKASVFAHTGIVVEKTPGSVTVIHAGVQDCYCDGNQWSKPEIEIEDENGEFKKVQKYQTMEECYLDCKKKSINVTSTYFNGSTMESVHHIYRGWARPILDKN